MRLDFFMLADRAENDESGKLVIYGAGVTHVRVDSLPASLSLLVAVARFLWDEEDAARTPPRMVRLRWTAPTGDAVDAPAMEAVPPAFATGHEGEERATFYIVAMPNITFPAAGVYRVALVLEDETLSERTLVVFSEAPVEDLGP
jgi:hypothetical protein